MSATEGVGGEAPPSDSYVNATSPIAHMLIAAPRVRHTARPGRHTSPRPIASAHATSSKVHIAQPSSHVTSSPGARTISEMR